MKAEFFRPRARSTAFAWSTAVFTVPGLRTWFVARYAMVVAMAAVVAACGGGVDSGGTGSPVVSSVAVGPISGFGSVVVGGVHYDEAGAAITDDDGLTLAPGALKLGMVASIEAGAITPGVLAPMAKAYSLRVSEMALGPISAVDRVNCTVTVLGQRVVAVAATVLDASVPLSTGACRLSGLTPAVAGQALMVYGTWDAAQARIVASRVELRNSPGHYVLRGLVSSYALAQRSMKVNGQAIDLSGIAAMALPASWPSDTTVRLRLKADRLAAPWSAVSLQAADLALPSVEAAELEGRVSQFVSAQQFSVNGVLVDARAAIFSPSAAALALGVKVEIAGAVVSGKLVARTVKIESDDEGGDAVLEIEGRIEALDKVFKTMLVRGVTISWAGSPSFEGGTAADLALNRKVSIKGRLSADGQAVVATSVHLD